MANSNATAADTDHAKKVMLGGLGAQLGCLGIFLILTVWVFLDCDREIRWQLRWVLLSLAAALLCIVARNCYRCAEFAEGSFTRGALQQDESYYLAGEFIHCFCCYTMLALIDFCFILLLFLTGDAMCMLLACVVFIVADTSRLLPAAFTGQKQIDDSTSLPATYQHETNGSTRTSYPAYSSNSENPDQTPRDPTMVDTQG